MKTVAGRCRDSYRILVGASASTAYGRGLLLGAIRYAGQVGTWRLVPLNVGPDLFRCIEQERPDGILAQLGGIRTLTAIAETGIPTINLASRTEPQPLPRVIADPGALARLAADHFVSCGFQHFAFAGPPDHGYSRLRGEAFVAELRGRGLDCAVTAWDFFKTRQPAKRLVTWLEALPRPLAVFAANDEAAAFVVQTCLDFGLQVPEEVAVLGVDNDEIVCELSRVSISSIDVDPVRIGMEAACRLDQLMAGGVVAEEKILVRPHAVVARASTATIVFENPLVSRALRLLGRQPGTSLSVKEIVEELGVSRRTLERTFQEVLGRSPYQEIENRRMQLSERLLRESGLTVQEISRRAGYTDVRLLIQAFHRRHGMTPQQWRCGPGRSVSIHLRD